MKFTFKKHPRPTGLASVGARDFTDIKYYKCCVGFIQQSNDWKTYSVWLKILKKDIMEDKNPNCVWRNAIPTRKFASEKEAREFLNERKDDILAQYNLYFDKDN